MLYKAMYISYNSTQNIQSNTRRAYLRNQNYLGRHRTDVHSRLPKYLTKYNKIRQYTVFNFQKAKVGPKGAKYDLPEVVLDFVRIRLPNNIKAERRASAYCVTLGEFSSHVL